MAGLIVVSTCGIASIRSVKRRLLTSEILPSFSPIVMLLPSLFSLWIYFSPILVLLIQFYEFILIISYASDKASRSAPSDVLNERDEERTQSSESMLPSKSMLLVGWSCGRRGWTIEGRACWSCCSGDRARFAMLMVGEERDRAEHERSFPPTSSHQSIASYAYNPKPDLNNLSDSQPSLTSVCQLSPIHLPTHDQSLSLPQSSPPLVLLPPRPPSSPTQALPQHR
jgi:hypothetical protein